MTQEWSSIGRGFLAFIRNSGFVSYMLLINRVRLFNHTCCLVLYHLCIENPPAKVVNISSRPRSKWRPLPMDTVELEKLASRKLRINAKEAMRIAEHLYTQGFISYPRTETNIFPPSFNLPAMINEQTRDPSWGGFASRILADGPNPRQGNRTDNAHPPIHPTRYTTGLRGNEQRIYDLVVRHFLACCSKDAKGEETTVEINIAGEGFSASGLMITARNYLEVYPFDKWSDKTIPIYQLNSIFQPSSIEMVDGNTIPPPLLHEADLISLMEKHGIGTDATHAEHIETIKARRYVGVGDNGAFIPGELGIGLVEGYDSMGFELSKPKLRAEMESNLNRICHGHRTKQDVITEAIRNYKTVFEIASQQAVKLDQALSNYFGSPSQVTNTSDNFSLTEMVRKCPLCLRNDMVVKKKRDGFFMLSCLGYPKCQAVQFFPHSVVGAKPDSTLCSKCEPRPVHNLCFQLTPGSIPAHFGNEYVGCSTCDDNLINMIGIRPIRTSSSNSQPHQQNNRGGSTQGRGGSSGLPSNRGGSAQGRGGSSGLPRQPPFGPPRQPPFGLPRHSPHGPPRQLPPGPPRQPPPGPPRQPPLGRHPPGYSHPGPSGQPNTPCQRGPGFTSPGLIRGGEGSVVCACGDEAILLTVRNEQSANRGRKFYRCHKRDEEGKCDFFLWADQGSSDSGSYSNEFNSTPPIDRRMPGFSSSQRGRVHGGRGGGRGRSGARSVMCQCGLAAVERTVQQGNNRGRPFITCPKPRNEQCGFFEWTDNQPTSGGVAGRKRSSGYTGGEDVPGAKKRAPPTCSVCHIPGHTKRSCPQTR